MRAAILVAIKDLRLLARDRVALFWVGAFPLLFALLLGSVLEAANDGSRAPLALRVVDEANTPRSHALVRELEASGTIAVVRADIATAREAVRRAEAVAYVRISAEIESATERDSTRGVELGVDPSHRAEAAALEILTGEIVRRVAVMPARTARRARPVRMRATPHPRARGFPT